MGKAYGQLNLPERIVVQVHRERSLSKRAIALAQRAASMIGRGMRRNGCEPMARRAIAFQSHPLLRAIRAASKRLEACNLEMASER
jgi:IS30 family transposase